MMHLNNVAEIVLEFYLFNFFSCLLDYFRRLQKISQMKEKGKGKRINHQGKRTEKMRRKIELCLAKLIDQKVILMKQMVF